MFCFYSAQNNSQFTVGIFNEIKKELFKHSFFSVHTNFHKDQGLIAVSLQKF